MKRRSAQLNVRVTAKHSYTVIVHPGEKDEGGFWAEVPALRGCNTQGDTYQQTIRNAKQAIAGYLAMLIKLGEPIPVEKASRSGARTAVKVAV